MHSADEQAWDYSDLFKAIAREIDAADEQGRPIGVVKVSFCDVDIPAIVSNGAVYISLPLPFLFEAIASRVPERFRDMEVRVSIEGSAALPPDSPGGAFHREDVVIEGVVRSGGKR